MSGTHRATTVATALALALGLLSLPGSARADDTSAQDRDLPSGHYYPQAGEGKGGFAITDDFWTFYQGHGGTTVLGYPNSSRFTISGQAGFVYQGTQKELLQRGAQGQVTIANTFDLLHTYGFDDQMTALGIPKPVTGDDGSAGDFEKAKQTRLGWITDPDLKNLFFANPIPGNDKWDPVTSYGLPTSKVEKVGPFLVLRCQRAVLMKVVEPGTGQPVG